jgi:protein TonB
MTARFPIAIGLALVVTFALFWAMQALIGVAGELKEGRGKPSIEFVRLRKDTTPQEKQREKPKREKPDQPPPPPDISMSKANLNPDGAGALVPMIDPGDALAGGIGGGGGSDRDVVPLVRIDPDYPIRARQRSIEGWVVVSFTVSKTGAVKDAVVLQSHPGKIFDRAALQAVRKWKYNPKIQNGVATERTGIRVQLDFDMES